MRLPFFGTSSFEKATHYYGDKIRVLFFLSGILMLVSLPVFQEKLPVETSLSLVAIVLLTFLAGITNPKQVWLSFLNTAASLIGLVVFEYYAVKNFANFDNFFIINQLLAIIFFLAFYFSAKTLRGFYLRYK